MINVCSTKEHTWRRLLHIKRYLIENQNENERADSGIYISKKKKFILIEFRRKKTTTTIIVSDIQMVILKPKKPQLPQCGLLYHKNIQSQNIITKTKCNKNFYSENLFNILVFGRWFSCRLLEYTGSYWVRKK